MARAVVVLFARPPIAGRCKTRLAADVGDVVAAEVAAALLLDAWAVVTSVPDVQAVLCSPQPDLDHGVVAEVWDQPGADLGERQELALQRALGVAPVALVVGADVVTLTVDLLAAAVSGLDRADAVVLPVADGGYGLLGVRACPPGLLANLPWSVPETGAAVVDRLRRRLGRVVELPEGRDVDTLADLRAVVSASDAPWGRRTRAVARRLGVSGT